MESHWKHAKNFLPSSSWHPTTMKTFSFQFVAFSFEIINQHENGSKIKGMSGEKGSKRWELGNKNVNNRRNKFSEPNASTYYFRLFAIKGKKYCCKVIPTISISSDPFDCLVVSSLRCRFNGSSGRRFDFYFYSAMSNGKFMTVKDRTGREKFMLCDDDKTRRNKIIQTRTPRGRFLWHDLCEKDIMEGKVSSGTHERQHLTSYQQCIAHSSVIVILIGFISTVRSATLVNMFLLFYPLVKETQT